MRTPLSFLAACPLAASALLAFVPACSGGTTPLTTDASVDLAAPNYGDPLSWPVDKPGPYSVGYHELTATYTPPGSSAPRTIKVAFWYPTTDPVGDHPSYGPLIPDQDSFIDAPPAASPWPTGYPVLVHSHGNQGWAGANSHITRYLASHGWAVIEPEHKGNTISDTPAKFPLVLYAERPLDVRAALDLATNPPKGDLLTGRFDMARVAMSGHSFGTYTAGVVAGTQFDVPTFQNDCAMGNLTDCSDAVMAAFSTDLSEPRARLIVPEAGARSGYWGANPYDPRHIPVLSMFGTLNDGGELALQTATSGADYTVLEVQGGCHELFDLGNNFVGDYGNNVGSSHCNALPDDEGFAIVNTYLLAYLRQHILDDKSATTSAIVSGQQSISTRVTVHLK